MAFWERNTLILALGSILGGAFYFGFVVWQSLAIGGLAEPVWWVWLGYIGFQFLVSMLGMRIWSGKLIDEDLKALPNLQDERDTLIRSNAESWQGHAMSALIFLCMALWFSHGNPAIFFHSLVAALVSSELVRAVVQFRGYNRAT